MQNNQVVLSVNNVSKLYRSMPSLKRSNGTVPQTTGRLAVDSVSFEVYKGEVFGFLGPNGAGKSTLIKIICGLAAPTAGTVTICGKDIVKSPAESRKHLGAVVENPDFYTDITGRENLTYFAKLGGTPVSRVDEVLQIVGLKDRACDRVRTYSLGMKQRLGIAQALLDEPELLILDEPANGLDPAGIKEIRDLLRSLAHDKGVAVFVSSHLLSEMQLMCDRIAIINLGKLIEVKAIEEISHGSNEAVLVQTEQHEAAARVIVEKFSAVCDRTPQGLLVHVSPDKIPELNKELVLAGVAVQGIVAKGETLEDLFMSVTGGENK